MSITVMDRVHLTALYLKQFLWKGFIIHRNLDFNLNALVHKSMIYVTFVSLIWTFLKIALEQWTWENLLVITVKTVFFYVVTKMFGRIFI